MALFVPCPDVPPPAGGNLPPLLFNRVGFGSFIIPITLQDNVLHSTGGALDYTLIIPLDSTIDFDIASAVTIIQDSFSAIFLTTEVGVSYTGPPQVSFTEIVVLTKTAPNTWVGASIIPPPF